MTTIKKTSVVGILVLLANLAYWLVCPLRIYQVSASSMEEELRNGDWILIQKQNKGGFGWTGRKPTRGDIVVFQAPGNRDNLMVKRIIALEGDGLRIYRGNLILNGVDQQEPYAHYRRRIETVSWPVDDWDSAGLRSISVPAGTCFVMGDNRDSSFDSRGYGPISEESIVGVVRYKIRGGRFMRVSTQSMRVTSENISQSP